MNLSGLNLEPFLMHMQDCLRCKNATMTMGFAAMQGKLPPREEAENVLSLLCASGREELNKVRQPIGSTPLPRPKLQPVPLNEDEATRRRAETIGILQELENADVEK